MELTDQRLALLVDHYKETIDNVTRAYKRRDRLTVAILLVAVMMIFQMTWPAATRKALSSYFGLTEGSFDSSFLSSIIWFLLLATALSYFQVSVYLDRLYKYLAGLEDTLGSQFPPPAFTREGKFYESAYPPLSKWAHILYAWAFPFLVCVLVFCKITVDFALNGCTASNLMNSLIAAAIVITVVVYKYPALDAK